MGGPKHIFFLMNHVFWGFALSLIYVAVTGGFIFLKFPSEFDSYQKAFFRDFNCIISGGLIFGAVILVYKTQHYIPDLIGSIFTKEELGGTDYKEQRRRFLSAKRSAEFCAEFIAIGFLIFLYAGFPLTKEPAFFMIFFGCLQYAGGVYVGRKLFYIAQMLNAIGDIPIKKNIFADDRLGGVVTYVNALSAITMVFTYIHVVSYYNGPFVYNSTLGTSLKIFMLVPGIIAAPVVVLFNFYPRTILRKLYLVSIRNELDRTKARLQMTEVTTFERLSYLIEYDKLAQDELRNRLRTNLSDLPVLITLALMIADIVKG